MGSHENVWSNETEMLFLEHYHSESVLWDAKHPHHKDKNKHHDSWRRISTVMNIEVNQLKKKKDSLLSSYRFYRKKVRDSSHSGAGALEIYKPIWFAYSYMDSFLGEGLTVRNTTDTLNQESNIQDSQGNNQENVDPLPLSNLTITKRRRTNPPELQQAGSFIKEILANLNQALCLNNPQEKEDDCDRYGKILANKLRQLPEDDRLIFMHQIDGMFIQRRCSRNQSLRSSPIFVSSPSPSSNILQSHQQNTSRPGSSVTSYSEPISLHRTYYDSNHDSKMAQSEAIINNTTNITQYPPVIHIPEHSNTNTTRIRILSNQIVSPPPPAQTESFSQSQYECNLIGDAYENA